METVSLPTAKVKAYTPAALLLSDLKVCEEEEKSYLAL